MSDSSTVGIRAAVDLSALLQLSAALRAIRAEVEAINTGASALGVSTPGPGGGSSDRGGSPTAPPAGVVHGSRGLPAPGGGSAPPASDGGGGGGGETKGKARALPDPAEQARAEERQRAAELRNQLRQIGGAVGISSGGGGLSGMVGGAIGTAVGGPIGGVIGGALGSAGGGLASSAMSYAQAGAMQYLRMGTGMDPISLVLTSGHKYMEVSRILTQVSRRFREAEGSVAAFGGALGFTMEQSGQLANQLGGLTDSVGKAQFQRYAGFARYMGADPGAVMQSFGSVEQLIGGPMGDGALRMLAGGAMRQGMGQGRLAEYLQTFAGMTERMMMQTGNADPTLLTSARGAMAIAPTVFGATSPFAQGQRGADFASRLNDTMVSPDPAMRSFMLQAIGYGGDQSMSYVDALQRVEAGVGDPRNLVSMFERFGAEGLGREDQIHALRGATGGRMKVWEIAALVDTLGTDEGRARYQAEVVNGGDASREAFMSSLDGDKRKAFKSFAEQGKEGVSAGDALAVQIERLQMKYGEKMAEIMQQSFKTTEQLLGLIESIIGGDILGEIRQLAKNTNDLLGYARFMSDSPERRAQVWEAMNGKAIELNGIYMMVQWLRRMNRQGIK